MLFMHFAIKVLLEAISLCHHQSLTLTISCSIKKQQTVLYLCKYGLLSAQRLLVLQKHKSGSTDRLHLDYSVIVQDCLHGAVSAVQRQYQLAAV